MRPDGIAKKLGLKNRAKKRFLEKLPESFPPFGRGMVRVEDRSIYHRKIRFGTFYANPAGCAGIRNQEFK